jgi:periplasmic protein TonB
MFAESMLETSCAERSRRSWTTLTSFGLQAVVMMFLLLIPLIRPVAIPFLRTLETPVMLAPPPGPPPSGPPHAINRPAQSNLANGVVILPTVIPPHIQMVEETEGPPQLGPAGPYVPGSTGNGDPRGVAFGFGNSVRVLPPAPPPVATRPIRISSMSEGDLIRKVQPAYPPIARSARIQGQVLLAAIISKAGTIENLRVIAGPPMLLSAAIDAVKQWRYRPYILNDEPVEVETQITINFSLSGS